MESARTSQATEWTLWGLGWLATGRRGVESEGLRLAEARGTRSYEVRSTCEHLSLRTALPGTRARPSICSRQSGRQLYPRTVDSKREDSFASGQSRVAQRVERDQKGGQWNRLPPAGHYGLKLSSLLDFPDVEQLLRSSKRPSTKSLLVTLLSFTYQ